MLKATPKGWFSNNYALTENGVHIADLDRSLWRERGTLSIAGRQYSVEREGMRGAFVLQENGATVARAEKPSAWRRSFVVTYDGQQFVLEAESAWRRAFVLRQGNTVIGSMRNAGVFNRTALIDFPGDLPLPVRAFMAWLVIILWQRDDAAATTSVAAST